MKRDRSAYLWDMQQGCAASEVWRVLHENLPELHAAVSGLLDQVQSQRGCSE